MRLRRHPAVFLAICPGLMGEAGAASAAPSKEPATEAAAASIDPDATELRGATPVPGDPSPFQLGMGAGLSVGLGDVWEGNGDVISSSGGPVFLDLSVAPSYRIARAFALGIRGAVGLEPGSRAQVSSSGESLSLERRLWQLSATGRYQPQPGRGWYVALGAGAATVVDAKGNASVSQWAPLISAAAGYDLSVARPFSLGIELRAAYAPFGEGSRTSAAGYYDYQVSAWLGAGVVGNIMP